MRFRGAALLLASASALAGQDLAPGYELYGGFSTQRRNFVDRYGFGGALTVDLHRRLGIVGEATALFGTIDLTGSSAIPDGFDPELQSDLVTVLAGPRARIVATDRYIVSVHVLAGAGRVSTEFLDLNDQRIAQGRNEFSGTRFAAAYGGALDLRLTDRLAWRLQPDWIRVNGFLPRTTFRFSTGLAFRFGDR